MTPVKVATIIEIAWKIYRNRFKEFYRLTLINSFWIFVPVYGWAKYATMMGLLARLAYSERSGNPETIRTAKRYIKPKTWSFFGASLMASLILFLKLLRIPIVIIGLLLINNKYNIFPVSTIYYSIIIVYHSVLFFYYYWVASRLFLYELPLAIGDTLNVARSRDISWQLAENKSSFRLETIIFLVTSLIALFYLFFVQINNLDGNNNILGSLLFFLKLGEFKSYTLLMKQKQHISGCTVTGLLGCLIVPLIFLLIISYSYFVSLRFLFTEATVSLRLPRWLSIMMMISIFSGLTNLFGFIHFPLYSVVREKDRIKNYFCLIWWLKKYRQQKLNKPKYVGINLVGGFIPTLITCW